MHGYQEDFPVVDKDGELVGMLTRKEIFSAARSPEEQKSVRELMKTEFPTISPNADLSSEGDPRAGRRRCAGSGCTACR